MSEPADDEEEKIITYMHACIQVKLVGLVGTRRFKQVWCGMCGYQSGSTLLLHYVRSRLTLFLLLTPPPTFFSSTPANHEPVPGNASSWSELVCPAFLPSIPCLPLPRYLARYVPSVLPPCSRGESRIYLLSCACTVAPTGIGIVCICAV